MGDNSGLNGSLSHEDLEKIGGDHQKTGDEALSTDAQAARASAQKQGEVLLKTLQIPCTVTNARLVVSGTRQTKPGAREVEARVYEVACSEGMGYLLQTPGTDQPLGNSCLNAEEARAADVAKGKAPSYFCALPENRDVLALVSWLIKAGAGATCTGRHAAVVRAQRIHAYGLRRDQVQGRPGLPAADAADGFDRADHGNELHRCGQARHQVPPD